MKLKSKLKTVVSTAIAMSVGATMLPLSVSAELAESAEPYASTGYYDSRDVNRDGEIDIRDVVLFNRCMVGAEYISDFKQLDADTNGIVNFADSYCILAYTVGSSYSCSVDGLWSYTSGKVSSVPSPISAPTSAKYKKYTYATGTTTEYTLSLPKAYTAENSISTYTVFGDDDRKYMTNQSEFTGIVNIELGTQDAPKVYKGTARSTGFIVGDHQIATAAHCVYNQYAGEFQYGYYFLNNPYGGNNIYLYDEDGNRTGEKITPVEVHIPEEYYSKVSEVGSGNLPYCDYALITVKEDLSKYTHFSLGLTKDPYAPAFSNADIYISGIPDYAASQDNSTAKKIAKGVGKIYTGEENNRDTVLYYNTDETNGNSGSPVYTITKYKVGNTEYCDYTAIGIVKGGNYTRNRGTRVIPLIQKFYQNNPNFSY
ncbi:MAG: trypsin-like peptidase domain-containing protein [Oscillospiraceae bacterium]|nr:trypsin-like peptidase domain-containing protein [Oscillospiraceae bacterium]